VSLQSYIRHLWWDRTGPCRHGICVTEAPIAASGKREAAVKVIGVIRCGCNPGCHDGRSISWQSSWKKSLLLSAFFSGRYSKSGALDLVAQPGGGMAVGRAIAQRCVADARELVGQGASGLVVVGALLHRDRPGAQVVQRAARRRARR